MKSITNDYLIEQRKFRNNRQKLTMTFFIIAFIVAILVFWWLKLVGITVTGEAFCGLDEHTHKEECYTSNLVCDISETLETHAHTDECYQTVLICTESEHTHTPACYPDKAADVETSNEWLRSFENVQITNNVSENLAGIASSQIGYEESNKNYEYDSDGTPNGYTRYGEWYGNPYGRWDAMFVSFCLHYANINNVSDLKSSGAETMRLSWQARTAYASANEHSPQRGDVVFIDLNGDYLSDTVGIILSVNNSSLTVALGDSNNKVETKEIDISGNVLGYGLTSELYFAKDAKHAQTTEPVTSVFEQKTVNETPPLKLYNTRESNIKYITDLSEAVTNVTFKTVSGAEITAGSTIYVGQTYKVSLQFSETNNTDPWVQFNEDGTTYLTYQIPATIQCEEFTDWHPITATTEDGTVQDVGEYFINKDGLLQVRFYETTGDIGFLEKYSNVNFTIDFDATLASTQSGTSTEIEFNDEIKIDLNVDGGADVTSEKTHKAYDSNTHTVEYTVKVEAKYGVVHDLVIDDEIWENHYVLRDTILITDLDGNPLDPQPTVSNHPQHDKGATEGFSLSGFPAFAAGEGFLITYKTQIYDELLSNSAVDLWNGLAVNGKDSNNAPFEQKYVQDWLRVEPQKMTKDGKQSVVTDNAGNTISVIEWEVVIKKTNGNLNGTVLIDTLGEGLEYYTGKSIKIKRYDEWGNALSDIDLSWDNVTIDGNTMSFPLPDGYAFDIIYYTTYEDLNDGEQKRYTNSASVNIDGNQETAGGEADVIGFVPHVQKSASGNDGEYVYYTITADVPGAIKDWGNFHLTDMIAFWSYDNDAGYLYVNNIPQDMVITATTVSGRTITFTPYVAGGPTENTYILVTPAEGNQYHSFNILFNTSEATFSSSKWTLSEDSVLTITYKTPFDAKTGTEWTGELTNDKTLGEILMEGQRLSNEAYLNYTDGITGTASSTYEYSPKILKDSVVENDGIIDYTIVFNNTVPGSSGHEGYLNANTASAYFTDTFDEKLEYVDGSLTVTCYSPWQGDSWINKYTYEGSITGNKINLPASQFVYKETNNLLEDSSWYATFDTLEKYYKGMDRGGTYIFTYTLKVKDQYLNTTEHSKYTFTNTAEITWDNDGSTGPVKETTEYETGLLEKQAVQENNKLNFAIHINRNALDILDGLDTLTIEDTMTPNLSIYWESIKLFYEDGTDNWVAFDDADSKYTYTVTYDQTNNKLTFVVPDELHIRVDYTTLITEGGLVSVNNSVNINGSAQISDLVDATFQVQTHSGGATGSNEEITLLKQDGDTDVRLPNVTFLLYGPVGDPNAVVPDGADKYLVTDNNQTLSYIGSYTTGKDGTVVIKTPYLTRGGPYGLVEVSPPDGYVPLEKPILFYFYEPDPNGMIQTVTTLISVENYTYGFVLPETGRIGIYLFTMIGLALMTIPILYNTIRRRRERRLN